MNDYYQVRINLNAPSEDATDLAAAMLGDIGFESFVPDDRGITAYVKAELFDEASMKDVLSDCPLLDDYSVEFELVEGRDWNSEWEKNYFQPIIIGDKCVVHSSFHTDYPRLPYEIVIDPKMAFGTGHHATTSQVIKTLLELEIKGKYVIDMGTGTGILAILSAMLGASAVVGIEIDPMAYENALDNAAANSHPEIDLRHGDATLLDGIAPCDVFIANINRNIIVADMASYASALKSGGYMVLSGFYESDIPIVVGAAEEFGLEEMSHKVQDDWTCLLLKKS